MRRIELQVDSGEFVAIVEIPLFNDDQLPQVVMWGIRTFALWLCRGPSGLPEYRERFAVMSLTPSPGLPREEKVVEAPPPTDWNARTTLRGSDPDAPKVIDGSTGMQTDYVVLSDEERAKGFVRSVRDAYKHAICGAVTTMGAKLSETYAREPSFYGATYCCRCKGHFPVGADGEFTWYPGTEKVGT